LGLSTTGKSPSEGQRIIIQSRCGFSFRDF
jgi:hypothetical protein